MILDPDRLRTPQTALSPDERTRMQTLVNLITGERREVRLEDQHQLIARLVLNAEVPEKIQIHFETTKNCYLYAWFVYRFYPVAEQQACATLEFALRTRFPEFVEKIIKLSKSGNPPGLGSLLGHAKTKSVLQNDLFSSRFNWALRVAKERYGREIHTRAMQLGIEEYQFDDSHVQATEEDLTTDWLSSFIEYLPRIRNDLAHGSENLRDSVWHTLDIVCSMINMLYPSDQKNTA